MKDNRFIELVNLYVDRQITAAEAAELEAEMQGSPRRRAVYRQYCQMHRATTLVYDSFRANSSEQKPAEAREAGVVARFAPTRRRTPWTYYAGGLAAACLAMVFVVRQNAGQPVVRDIAPSARIVQPVAVIAKPVTPAPVQPAVVAQVRTGPVSLRTANLATDQDYAALLLALRREEQRAFANGQVQPAQLPSLFEDGVFDSPQNLPANTHRTFRPAQGEFTAFQFQR